MQIEHQEKKSGTGVGSATKIGYWKGELLTVNPSASKLKELYSIDGEVEDPVYQGTDKNQKDWSLLRFMFQEEVSKDIVEFKVFLSKEVSEWDKTDGTHRIEFINQHGEGQIVSDEKDLFSSFTHVQKWNNDEKKWEDVLDESGQKMKKIYRKAYKGELELYSMLRSLVNIDWFSATDQTNLLIKIDDLMRGKLSDITNYIGTDSLRPVVGMLEITPKDTDNGVVYYSNCVGKAWMPGGRIAQCNLFSQSNSWNTLEDAATKKGKTREIYNFYHTCKRSKNIVVFQHYTDFVASEHQAAGSDVIRTDSSIPDNTDY